MSETVYTIDDIKRIVAPVAKRHGVERIYLFGSYARGAATPYSDIDLCVDAAALRGLFALAGLRADLEEALNKELDLITVNSLKYNKDMGFLENLRKDQVLIYEMAS